MQPFKIHTASDVAYKPQLLIIRSPVFMRYLKDNRSEVLYSTRIDNIITYFAKL
jgi:hypothetical protein